MSTATPMGDSPSSAASSATLHRHIDFTSPPTSRTDELLDADADADTPLLFRRIDNVIGPASPPGFTERELEERLLLASDTEPTSQEEAIKHEHWCLAMLDEMTSIEASGTWELVEAPPRMKPIGLKWVYKTKRDATGVITKHKARLIAKGYVQWRH